MRGDDAPTERLDLAHGLGQVRWARHRVVDGVDVGTVVDGDDVGALLREPDGVATTLSTRCPCDEGDLALNATCHVRSFGCCHLISTPASTGSATPVM